MDSSSGAVDRHTPTITAFDGRGLALRQVAYLRHPDTPQMTRSLVSRHRYGAAGFLVHSADSRLHASGLANFRYRTDLAGNVLHTRSADAGTSIVLNDAAGRRSMALSNIRIAADDSDDFEQAVTHTWVYEDATSPGRPLMVSEQTSDGTLRVIERFVYGGVTEEEQALNLAGQCVKHYDTAGLLQVNAVSLAGAPHSISRLLPDDADNPATLVDWQGDDPLAWAARLAPDSQAFTTLTTVDATGAVLTTIDSEGNRRREAYDVAGSPKARWLQRRDASEQGVVVAMAYSSAGQILREEHGNGVVVTYGYEPETQRLATMKAVRPAGHPLGGKVLLDLCYQYDAVGNVLGVGNRAEQVRFWRNQQVLPQSTCVYDSLYRLVAASGREMANSGRSCLAAISQLADDATCTNYSRNYLYDESGNLTRIRHSSPAANSSHTVDITLGNRSCRGVSSTLASDPLKVDALFTPGGQQRILQPGQSLYWTPRAELQRVVLGGAEEDSEHYRYDASSQRVLKVASQGVKGTPFVRRVLYLPGLELRTTAAQGVEQERLQVICLDQNVGVQVRLLHWVSGKPVEIDNDQLRYSYSDLIGSSLLEVDGAGRTISREDYYPYGGTSVWAARSVVEASYKTIRYSGKERDLTGLYYYGHRYYQSWLGRWLSADPAGTVDGLNLFSMVGNNPVSYFDARGLMLRSPQGGGFQPPPATYQVLARGLSQFSSQERNQVRQSLHAASGVLDKVTRLQGLPADQMKTFFGPDHRQVARDVVATWQQTKQILAEYDLHYPGHEKFTRVTEVGGHTVAEVEPYDFTGRVLVHDLFFAATTSDEMRTQVLIHELSHLRRSPGIRAVGVGTQDFFYLKDAAPEKDSAAIVDKGRIKRSDVNDVAGLFNEVALLNQWHVIKVDPAVMTYGEPWSPQYMTVTQAMNAFKKTPALRARIAARNADSIAFAATKIASRV